MPKPLYGEAGTRHALPPAPPQGGPNVFYDAAGLRQAEPDVALWYIGGLLAARRRPPRLHQPVDQLLHAPGPRLRGAGQRLLQPRQPQRRGARAQVRRPARDRAHRVPAARRHRATSTWRSPRSSWPASTASGRGSTRPRSGFGPIDQNVFTWTDGAAEGGRPLPTSCARRCERSRRTTSSCSRAGSSTRASSRTGSRVKSDEYLEETACGI